MRIAGVKWLKSSATTRRRGGAKDHWLLNSQGAHGPKAQSGKRLLREVLRPKPPKAGQIQWQGCANRSGNHSCSRWTLSTRSFLSMCQCCSKDYWSKGSFEEDRWHMICDQDFKRRVLVYIRRIMIEEEYIYIIIINLKNLLYQN